MLQFNHQQTILHAQRISQKGIMINETVSALILFILGLTSIFFLTPKLKKQWSSTDKKGENLLFIIAIFSGMILVLIILLKLYLK